MFYLLAALAILGATVAATVAATLAAANAALHWPKTRVLVDGNKRTPPRLSVRGWLDEAVVSLLALLGPIASWLPAPAAGDQRNLTVLLLPDPRLPASASWLLARRLRRAGWTVAIERVATTATHSQIDTVAAAADNRAANDGGLTLVGIGAGGLAARRVAARSAAVGRTVTIATPHSGTTSPVMPSALRPGSDYLRIVKEEDPKPRSFDAISIYSPGDAWLAPTEAAYYPGAYNIEVTDTGHLSMLFSSRIFRYLEENLSAELSAGGAGE